MERADDMQQIATGWNRTQAITEDMGLMLYHMIIGHRRLADMDISLLVLSPDLALSAPLSFFFS